MVSGVVMEEKERYELIGYCSYRDTETGVISDNFVDILNQQDKRIKELKGKILIQLTNNADNVNFMENQRRENQQLKQQLKDTEESYNNTMRYLNKTRSELLNLPKKIVEEIRSKCCVEDKCKDGSFVLGINEKDLDTILKEYGGEDE